MRRAGKYAIATGERLRHVRQVLGYTLKAVEDKKGGDAGAMACLTTAAKQCGMAPKK